MNRPRALLSVTIAGVLCLLLAQLPGFGPALYPLRLLTTFVHEGGHAVATLITGGQVVSLTIGADGSGLTLSAGGWRPLILSAGYLGSTLVGCLLLQATRWRQASRLLLVFGLVLLFLTIAYARSLLTWTLGLFWGVVLLAWALKGPQRVQGVVVGFLGVETGLNAFSDLHSLFDQSLGSQIPTDAAMMSHEMVWGLLPPAFWAIVWAAISLLLTGITLRKMLRSP